jgi:hypothetical protein
MQDQGYTFVQDFPDDCVPIRHGRLVGKVDHLVSADPV